MRGGETNEGLSPKFLLTNLHWKLEFAMAGVHTIWKCKPIEDKSGFKKFNKPNFCSFKKVVRVRWWWQNIHISLAIDFVNLQQQQKWRSQHLNQVAVVKVAMLIYIGVFWMKILDFYKRLKGGLSSCKHTLFSLISSWVGQSYLRMPAWSKGSIWRGWLMFRRIYQ